MGGWKLEVSRFAILIAFPVLSFWAFNQPGVFDFLVKRFKFSDTSKNDALMKEWKESMMEKKRNKDYEEFLRRQTEFETNRKIREQNQI